MPQSYGSTGGTQELPSSERSPRVVAWGRNSDVSQCSGVSPEHEECELFLRLAVSHPIIRLAAIGSQR